MLRRALPRFLIAALTLATASHAYAQAASGGHNRYKWRDGAGNLQYGDVLPSDVAKLGYEVVNSQGIVVKRVERAKSAAEAKEAKAAASFVSR